MRFAQLKLGPLDNFVYLLADDDGEGAVVDPSSDADAILAAAERLGCRIRHALVTHAHPDHVDALAEVRRRTGARVAAHAASPLGPDVPLRDGDVLEVGALRIRAHATPGHQPDHVCYEVEDRILTGDTLFVGECGRADLPGSDPRALWRSLHETLARLPRHLVVCPGHDYGPTPTSTLEREFRENYTLAPRTEDEFVRFMAEP